MVEGLDVRHSFRQPVLICKIDPDSTVSKVAIEGDPEANEILIVGNIGREDIHCAIGHILFLV
jgi:hypothetical protein